MGSIWKTILGLVVFILLVFGCINVVSANNDAVAAENYLNEVSEIISESNLSSNTIQKVIKEAKDNGYELTVNKKSTQIGSGYAELTLKYEYKIPMLGVSSEHEKHKVIR